MTILFALLNTSSRRPEKVPSKSENTIRTSTEAQNYSPNNVIPLPDLSLLGQKERFLAFSAWYVPHGHAGLDEFAHGDDYSPDAFFISLTPRFFDKGDGTKRIRGIKAEYNDRNVVDRTSNKIIDEEGLIGEPFLSFLKAWLNVWLYYTKKRSFPAPALNALVALEYSLRTLNNGDSSPWLINRDAVNDAQMYLSNNNSRAPAYEASQHLEILVAMLQAGYKSRNYNFEGAGFNLLEKPFEFKNSLKDRDREKAIKRDEDIIDSLSQSNTEKRLSTEEVIAVGMAYRLAKQRYGEKHYLTYYAALLSMALIVSVRPAEVLGFGVNSLYVNLDSGRVRLRLYRPKTELSQDLAIPKDLSAIAQEVFETLESYTATTRKSIDFYQRKWDGDIDAIDELYEYDTFFEVVSSDYVELATIAKFLGRKDLSDFKNQVLKKRFSCHCLTGIDKPQDVCVPTGRLATANIYLSSDVFERCNSIGVNVVKKANSLFKKYMSSSFACTIIPKTRHFVRKKVLAGLDIYDVCDWVSTSEIYQVLLNETKDSLRNIPFWPYADKDCYMPISDSLAIELDKQYSNTYYTNPYYYRLITSSNLRAMYSGTDGKGGELFKRLNIVLKDGNTPSVGIYDLRKYHQTQALLVGVSEVIADKLAGRNTGMQSAHYDKRTTREVINQSIDIFDPNEHFTASGPRVENKPNNPVERQVFLYENSAPKQVTEVGGCVTDWALNPCELYGDCMRCGESVWMKGDKKRLPNIEAMYEYNTRMLQKADERIDSGNDGRATIRLRDQYRDVVDRCLLIFQAEEDDSIPNGHIVTFNKAQSADGVSDLVEKLKWEHR